MKVSKVVLLGILLSLALTSATLSANADQVMCMRMPPVYSLMYSHTDDIMAGLTFSGNTAKCSGEIHPTNYEDVIITVSLYKQSGTSWILLDS